MDEIKYPKFKRNTQSVNIEPKDLERMPYHGDKFDSTIEERERNYTPRGREPRFGEYR